MARTKKKAPPRVSKKGKKKATKKRTTKKRTTKKRTTKKRATTKPEEPKGPIREPKQGAGPKGRGMVVERFIRNKVLYQLEWIKCTKCKKPEGKFYGPYWYCYSVVGGRWVSKYVGKKRP